MDYNSLFEICEKCPNTEFFLVRIFLNLKIQENIGEYRSEKTPYLDTSHAILNSTEIMKLKFRCKKLVKER